MKINRNKQGFTLVELLVVIVIIASLAALTTPMIKRQIKKADRTEATNNIKQIGIALFEFETNYGALPGASTLTQLPTDTGFSGSAGSYSNDYFLMLFQAGITDSEKMFYAKAQGTKKPDSNITGSNALAAGEVGFGYVTINAEGLSSAGNSARPVAMSPLTPGATTFDPGPFDKDLVVLRMDQSAENLRLSVAADATVGTLPKGNLDPFGSSNPIWGGQTPTINPPLQLGAQRASAQLKSQQDQ